jgi:hypothetical protein
MSRTHKTDPYWVKLSRPSRIRKEHHNHEKGICDLTEPTQGNWRVTFRRGKYCYYTVSYYGWNEGFYGRGAGSWFRAELAETNGSNRAKLRKDIHEMLKLDFEGIEEYDVINPRARNAALWWYY